MGTTTKPDPFKAGDRVAMSAAARLMFKDAKFLPTAAGTVEAINRERQTAMVKFPGARVLEWNFKWLVRCEPRE